MSDDMILDPVQRLSRDLQKAAFTLGVHEVRFLVDAYYMMQDDRKRTDMQKRMLAENDEPNAVIDYLFKQNKTLENQIKKALDKYTNAHKMGSWMRQIYGIGPVISAGLLAHIDIKQCPTVGHIYTYAGLHNGVVWLGPEKTKTIVNSVANNDKLTQDELIKTAHIMKADPKWLARRIFKYEEKQDYPFMGIEDKLSDEQYVGMVLRDRTITKKAVIDATSKRPWNTKLKTLIWKAGQSFMKFSNVDECFYGKLYRERKLKEIEKNEAGLNAAYAATRVETVGKDTEARKYYESGKIPDAQVDARARRYAVKIFLSHMHEEWFRREFNKEPPRPFAIAILGHAHYIPPPV